ncbi:MAG: hypothetical protein PCFJNLEI_02589 [Verrucomicrobiae bacterium]|nr:hypothetical protein [Verrucomicrobiae bacterium]
MQIIDAHIHFIGNHPDSLALLEELDVKLLNVCAALGGADWRKLMWHDYRALAREQPARFAWCTAFDLPDFQEAGYADRVLRGLEQDFADGAVACKVWKNIGMELKDPAGNFVMIDHPVFAPIFEYLAERGKTLLMHIGEPLACWQPLDVQNPHYGYYSQNPQWHMYGRSDVPGHAAQVAARDRVLENHPRLRVVGAHLGSLEFDVREIGRRLDRYPNFAVDTSARLADLAFQDGDRVREFIGKYSDRVLFGTDIVAYQPQAQMTAEDRGTLLRAARQNYHRQLAYFGGTAPVEILNRQIPGLGLPEQLMEKLFRTNAQAWYPGI